MPRSADRLGLPGGGGVGAAEVGGSGARSSNPRAGPRRTGPPPRVLREGGVREGVRVEHRSPADHDGPGDGIDRVDHLGPGYPPARGVNDRQVQTSFAARPWPPRTRTARRRAPRRRGCPACTRRARDPEREEERPRGHQPHPEPGERPRADTHGDRGQRRGGHARGLARTRSRAPASRRGVTPLLGLEGRHHRGPVVQGDGHVRGGGVEREQHQNISFFHRSDRGQRQRASVVVTAGQGELSSWSIESASARPSPHSTTVTASSISVSRSRSSRSAELPSR